MLPGLTEFNFDDFGEYLEVLVAHIDASRLNNLRIAFFDESDSGGSFRPWCDSSNLCRGLYWQAGFQVEIETDQWLGLSRPLL